MFRALVLLLAVALLLPGTVLGQSPTGNIFPYPTHVETLDNGLQVLVIPMSSGGLAAYWSIVRTGSRDEVEPGRTGFAHFFEHMMFRGTEKYPSDDYDDLVTSIGADTNAFTTDDLTAYYLNIASDDLETVMDIESDRFRNLSYPEEMFETEAGAVYGEYRKNRMNPFFSLSEELRRTAFVEHTYGHTTMGYEEDIKGMPGLFDYSKGFFKRFYRPENVVLVIVGDIEVESTLDLVRRYYDDWEPGYQAPDVRPEPPQTEARRIDVDYPGPALPILWIGYKAPAFDPADLEQAAARLLCNLSFGETSAVYKRLVLEEQVTEFVSANLTPNRDPGLLDIIARIKDPEKIDDVIAALDQAIADAQANPPDAGRLADLKSRLKYEFLMGLDTPANVMGNLVRIIAVTGGIEAIETLYQTIDKVTPEDVQKAAQNLLAPERRTVAVLRGES